MRKDNSSVWLDPNNSVVVQFGKADELDSKWFNYCMMEGVVEVSV